MTSAAPRHLALARLESELEACSERARELARQTDEEEWGHRSDPDRWSLAEAITHLSLTSEAYLPLIRSSLDPATEEPPNSRKPRRDPMGWLLSWMMEPPVRFRLKTSAAFLPVATPPGAAESKDAVLERFLASQEEIRACLHDSKGKAIDRIRMASPFDGRIRYNLYSAFCILTAHQRRHLWICEGSLLHLDPS